MVMSTGVLLFLTVVFLSSKHGGNLSVSLRRFTLLARWRNSICSRIIPSPQKEWTDVTEILNKIDT